MTVIDVHTHMLSQPWFDLLKEKGGPGFEVRQSKDAPLGIFAAGAPFMTLTPQNKRKRGHSTFSA